MCITEHCPKIIWDTQNAYASRVSTLQIWVGAHGNILVGTKWWLERFAINSLSLSASIAGPQDICLKIKLKLPLSFIMYFIMPDIITLNSFPFFAPICWLKCYDSRTCEFTQKIYFALETAVFPGHLNEIFYVD